MCSKRPAIMWILALMLVLFSGASFAAAPTVTSVVRASAVTHVNYTNATSVNYTVTFDQAVSGVTTSCFTPVVTPINGATAITAGVTGVSGGGNVYTVTVSVTGAGAKSSVRLDVPTAGTTIVNGAATPEAFATAFTTGEDYIVDHISPEVIITKLDGQIDPSNQKYVKYLVEFKEETAIDTYFAEGVDYTTAVIGNIALSGTADPDPTKTEVYQAGGSTNKIEIWVTGMTASGQVTMTLLAGAFKDWAGNNSTVYTSADVTGLHAIDPTPSTGAWYGKNTFTWGLYTTITRVSPNPTNTQYGISDVDKGKIIFKVQFNEPVKGFTTDDLIVQAKTTDALHAITVGKYLIEQEPKNKTIWNIELDGMTDTWAEIQVKIPAGAVEDNDASGEVYGLVNIESNTSPNTFSSFPQSINPAIISEDDVPPAVGGTNFRSEYKYGNIDTSISIFSKIDWVTYDIVRPTVVIEPGEDQNGTTSGAPTINGPIRYTVTFSEPVYQFGADDINVIGTAGGNVTSVTPINNLDRVNTYEHPYLNIMGMVISNGDDGYNDGRTYNVFVDNMSTKGTVEIRIDPLKNANLSLRPRDAAGNYSLDSSDEPIIYYDPAPSVTINQAAGQADPTSGSPINFTATFSKPVTGFLSTDVTLTGTAGVTSKTVTEVAPNDGTTYNVAVVPTGSGTVVASIAANVAQDADLNWNYASTSTDATVTYDEGVPTVTITKKVGQPDPTTGSPINFTVVFSEPVTGFEWVANNVSRQDVSLSGTAGPTTAVVSGSGSTYNVAVSGMTGPGNVTVAVGADKAVDSAGNGNEASSSATVVFAAPLTVTVNQAAAQADPTNAMPVVFDVVFNRAVTNFTSADVTLTGTAGATTAVVTGSGTTYVVEVTGMTGSGTVLASVGAGVATDASTFTNEASTSTDNQVTYDLSIVGVTITQAASQADPTSGTPINFSVVFSEPVTGFVTGDVTITGTAPGSKIGTVTGTGSTYNVAVSGMTGAGTVIVAIAAGKALSVAAGLANVASTSTDDTVTYDPGRVSVAIDQAAGQADPANGSPINFTVIFSKSVTGFTTGDVTLDGTAGATAGPVTGSGTTYNVAVTGMTKSGTVIVSIPEGTAQDSVGNTNTASSSTDNTVDYFVPLTAVVSKAASQVNPTSAEPVRFTVVFNRAVTDFAAGDVSLSGTAGATTAAVTNPSSDNKTFSVAVTGIVSSGTVIVSLGANVAHDANGFGNQASGSAVVTFDNGALSVTINKAAGQADPTNFGTIYFTAVFSKSVNNFTTGDVTLAGTAVATNAVVSGSGTTYLIAVSGMTGDGTVIATIAAGVATDSAANSNTVSTSTDNSVLYDATSPDVTINQKNPGQVDPTAVSPINFTVVFTETVTDFATGDVSLSGTAGATTQVVTGSGKTYNVAVTGMTGQGTVVASIAAGRAHDAAGNASRASSSSDNVVTFNVAPTVTITQASGQVDPTSGTPINFSVVFSEPVTGFATGDVSFTGTASGSIVGTVTGSGATYNVAVSGMTGSGTIVVSIPAGKAKSISANLDNLASTSADDTVTYDVTRPGVTINQASTQADPTSNTTIYFTAVFNEEVYNFVNGDVTLSGTAEAASHTISSIGGSRTNYTIAVRGMTKTGTVIVTIPASVAQDSVGNTNTASTSTDNQVIYRVPLTVEISKPTTQDDPATSAPIEFKVLFNKPVDDFASADVAINGTASFSGKSISVTNSGDYKTYSVLVYGMSASGTVIGSIAANIAHDTDGVGNTASGTATVDYQVTAPAVTINQYTDPIDSSNNQSDPTNEKPINFKVVFDTPVTGFSASGVVISGSAGGTKTATVTEIGTNGTTYKVAVNGMTTSGTVIADVSASAAYDSSGKANDASTSTDNVVGYDLIAPTATINQASSQTDPANGSPIHFTAIFSKPVSGFTGSAVTLTGTAVPSNATVSQIAPMDGSAYDVSVGTVSGEGTVIANILAGAVDDLAGNPVSAATFTDNQVTVKVTPGVTINQAAEQIDPTNDSPILFTAIFSTPVLDFAAADVTLGGTAGATVASVTNTSGDKKTYTVSVNVVSSGPVTASIAAGVAHSSISGIANTASISADNKVVYDVSALTVMLSKSVGQADPTNASPIRFTAEFNKAVDDFASEDVTISGTAAGTKTAVVTDSGDHKKFAIAVSGMTSSGTVVASIVAAVAHDSVGNANAVSTPANVTVQYDNAGPTVTINETAGQANPMVTLPVKFTVVFSKDVTDFTKDDLTLVRSPEKAGDVLTAVVTGSLKNYTVEVSGATSSCTITATIAANKAHDVLGNGNSASTSTDNSITYDDGSIPTVIVDKASAQADPTGTSPINFTVTFSKVVTPVGSTVVSTAAITGTAGANKAVVTPTINPMVVNVAISGMTKSGTVILKIPAGVVQDSFGHKNTVSNSATVNYDVSPLTVTINQPVSQVDPTNAKTINFTAVFSKSVADFVGTDVTIAGTSDASTATVTDSGDGKTFNVAITGFTKDGTVIVSLAAGVAHDSIGNANTASTSTDNTVTIDNSVVEVTVDQAATQKDPTNLTTVDFTAVFSRAVTDFTIDDVTVGGTAGGVKTVAISGTGPTYKITISGLTTSGTVTATIKAGKVHDAINNTNTASTVIKDGTVTYDVGIPTVTITFPTTEDSCTRNTTKLLISGTASDTNGIESVAWEDENGNSGICTGKETWSASDITIHGASETIMVTATDKAGNTALTSLKVTVIAASPGTAWTGLAMVSLPIIPDGKDPKPIVGFNNNSWSAYLTASGAYSTYPNILSWFDPQAETPGRGFWAYFKSALTPGGTILDQTKAAKVKLYRGWNLIGVPFISSVKWDLNAIRIYSDNGTSVRTLAEAAAMGLVAEYAWGWRPDSTLAARGEYFLVYDPSLMAGATGELKPWQGYWVRATVDCEMEFPGLSQAQILKIQSTSILEDGE